jgi:WD40 repeat protein
VSGSEDGNVRVWDTRVQQVTQKFKHSQGFTLKVLNITWKYYFQAVFLHVLDVVQDNPNFLVCTSLSGFAILSGVYTILY